MKKTTLLHLLAVFQILFFVSCASPGVKKRNSRVGEASSLAALLDQSRLSPEADAYLKREGLPDDYKKDPQGLVVALRQHLKAKPSAVGRLSLIEVCTITARRVEKKDPKKAVGYYLAAAEVAVAKGFEVSQVSSGTDKWVKAYNTSTEEVVRILFDPEGPWDASAVYPGPGKLYRINLRKSGAGIIDPTFYDDIYPADYMEFKDVEFKRNITNGVGAALVGHREGKPERRKENPFMSPLGMALPVNATLDFSSVGDEVDLAFYDLMLRDSIRIAGRQLPLSADRSAPLAIFYNYLPKQNVGMGGLMHPDEYADRMGLFELEPFRDDQIPVIFVHGLMSSPKTWLAALNQLSSDPKLRERYQFLVFSYPTGYPIPYSSANLRRTLKEFQQKYDPGHNSPTMRNMVIVGHSMGGLLTSAQIRDSGDTFTSKFFTKPIEQIEGFSEKQKSALKSLLIYKANPDLSRAVFVAAPHRGSGIATNSIGEMGIALIKFPLKALTATSVPLVDGMSDVARKLIAARPDGIKDLDPYAPELMTVLEQKVRKGTVMHSIVGRDNPEDKLEDSTDTVVPYWSAHLDDAVSEKAVHAKHTTITRNQDSNEEIRRILYLHVGMPYSKGD